MSEILAPAGGKESAIAAINAGADAIYLGMSSFSARSSADNFDLDGFKEIAAYAHAFGVKIYVAMNTAVKDGELESFLSLMVSVWNDGADAIIISDVFLGKYIKSVYPQIVLHLSTQAGICNAYGARLAVKCGFSRVILARETSLEDIRAVASVIETEVFVQGALCTCFSGQCYMSSFAGGNSGNRGRCKQPCRKRYSLDREGFGSLAYRLSLSDLCVGEKIGELAAAGVTSFKIEGRMRRPEYVSAAVKYYKNILAGTATAEDLSDLKRTFNRGNYTCGLAFGQSKNFISSAVQGHIGEYAGVVKVENGKYICQSAENFNVGDGFKILRDGAEIGGAEFVSPARGGFVISSQVRLKNGDKVFVTTDTRINRRLSELKRRIKLEISANFCAGKRAEATLNGKKFFGDGVLQTAESAPLTELAVKNCFLKTDKYPYDVTFGQIVCDSAFVPASELNRFRREVYAKYFLDLAPERSGKIVALRALPDSVAQDNRLSAVVTEKREVRGADIVIFKPNSYDIQPEETFGRLYLFLPPFMTGGEIERFLPLIKSFGGIYGDGVWAAELATELKKPFFGGCGINISNRIAVDGCGFTYITLSKELTESELKPLSRKNTFALSSGDIKVMDLIYCTFGRKCGGCDRRYRYVLKDETGREFPVRRYETSVCRFEVYNCAVLVGVSPTGTLIDCSLNGDADRAVSLSRDIDGQKKYFGSYTYGHLKTPVL